MLTNDNTSSGTIKILLVRRKLLAAALAVLVTPWIAKADSFQEGATIPKKTWIVYITRHGTETYEKKLAGAFIIQKQADKLAAFLNANDYTAYVIQEP